MSDYPQKQKIVDDCCSYDWKVDKHFFHICDFLTITARNGIIQNPAKFVFCRREVEFCGFRIRNDGVMPSEHTIEAIKNFPRPKNLTDIRSLFGLVEQVSFCFAKSKYMEPFRDLLKSKDSFQWTQDLQNVFNASTYEICD